MSIWNPNYIKAALAHLRRANPGVFGAEMHKFRLNPPVPESEVRALEQLHQIQLPPDYRDFITQIGNGGAGPSYGLFRLGEVDSGFEFRRWDAAIADIGDLSAPFRFDQSWNDLSGQPSYEPYTHDEDEYDSRQSAFELTYWAASLNDGAIPICHEGCAIRVLLVVSGPQRGYLWRDSRSEFKGLAPLLLADGTAATFYSWYQEWLEDALKYAGQ